eukprot:COSAG02_NODE_974_length_15518_cov_97.334717_12_plen_211_part_00
MGLPHHDLNKAPLRVVTVLIFLSDGFPRSGALQFPCFGGTGGRGMDDVCETLQRGFRAGRRAIDYNAAASKQSWNTTAHSKILEACTSFPSPATRFAPKAGRAVMFRSATSSGIPVETTWHAACPIKEGAPVRVCTTPLIPTSRLALVVGLLRCAVRGLTDLFWRYFLLGGSWCRSAMVPFDILSDGQEKLTMQFFKEFPRDSLPTRLQT